MNYDLIFRVIDCSVSYFDVLWPSMAQLRIFAVIFVMILKAEFQSSFCFGVFVGFDMDPEPYLSKMHLILSVFKLFTLWYDEHDLEG